MDNDSIGRIEDERLSTSEGISFIKRRRDGVRVRIILKEDGPKEYVLPDEDEDYG